MRLKLVIITLFVFCISLNANALTIFSDDFSDGSLADWDTNTGAWSAATFKAVGGGLDGSTLSHSVATVGGSDYNIVFKNNPNSVGLSNSFGWFTDQNGVNDFRGYRVVIRTDGFQLLRANVGGGTTTLLSNANPIAAGTDHNISIIHKTDGNIQVWIDATSQGSVIDTTYTSGTKIFLASTNTGANGVWDDININVVGTKTVTVLRPINEKTLQTIYKPWNVSVTGISTQFVDNNANTKVFFLPESNGIANFLVDDSNTTTDEYYARNYVVYSDNNSSVTIQPYLISVDDGILVNLKTADLSTNQTLPNIRIIMYAGINGSNAIVEDRLTDSAGIAQFVMLAQKNYDLLISSPSLDQNYFNGLQTLTASQQNFTIWINYFDNTINISPQNTRIIISPTTPILTTLTQTIDVNIDTNATFDRIYLEGFDSNRFVDVNSCVASPCNVKLTFNFGSFDSNFLIMKVIIQNGDFNFTRNITYTLSGFRSGIVSRLQNIKNELGPVPLGVIMFVTIFFLISFLGSNPLGNNMSQIFLIVIAFGAFYWLWFLDNKDLFPPFLAALFGVMLIYFWSRQKGGP